MRVVEGVAFETTKGDRDMKRYLVVMLVLVAACGDGGADLGAPSLTTVAVTPTQPPTSVTQPVQTTSVSAPPSTTLAPTTAPPPARLDSGLFCRDLARLGHGFGDAMVYWVREGLPDRMDADHNGIPCETVYPPDTVTSVLWFERVAGQAALPSGLFCRDLNRRGYLFAAALAYWVREGAPARMDADRNRLPCETVYPWAEIEAVMTFDGSEYQSPAPRDTVAASWERNPGWPAPVTEPCCDQPARGPESPPLPPSQGPFPHDGAYSIEVTRTPGASTLRVAIRRWVPCADLPDQCVGGVADFGPDDITTDSSVEVVRDLALDQRLRVVVNTIPVAATQSMVGSGAAFARLLDDFDDAYDKWILGQSGDFYQILDDLALRGASDPSFPFGVPPDFGPQGPLGFRGPTGTYLVVLPELKQGLERGLPRGPGAMYFWWVTLEIRNGAPILYVNAGRIAG